MARHGLAGVTLVRVLRLRLWDAAESEGLTEFMIAGDASSSLIMPVLIPWRRNRRSGRRPSSCAAVFLLTGLRLAGGRLPFRHLLYVTIGAMTCSALKSPH
jgi:cyanate permease